MKRLLLTGISGSIGIHTFGHIMHNTDWHVVGIASYKHKGWIDRIDYTIKDHPDWRERLTLITHDLNAPFSALTKNRIGHVDYIINMAALSDVEASIQNPVPFIQNNINSVLNMLEYARECEGLEAFIQISTDEVYGATTKTYQHPEWAPIVPSNPYSASKAAQEAIAISYWRTYGVPLIITNTMNNFGEMQQGSKYPAMVQKWIQNGEKVVIHGKGDQIGTRYYIHSRNKADALLFILQKLPAHRHEPGAVDKPDRYNIVGDVQLDNLELAQLISKQMGKELKYDMVDFHSTRPGHDPHYGLDGTKLRELGWKSPISFEDSLKSVIEWQANHPEWLI
jgi:dTDP-glucose 4,6-dehydratase